MLKTAGESTPVALVTGAARRLGKAIALHLAKNGYDIGLHYHESVEEAQQTADEIRARGREAYLLPADLTDPQQIESMFTRLKDRSSSLRVLVNSAGGMQHADLRTLTVEEWDRTLNLNLRAAWLCSQAAVKLMEPNGGVIVNITDTGTAKTWSGYPAYLVAKTGLETLTRLLARTLAPNIRVNAVAPGLILPGGELDQKIWQELVQKVPLKGYGNPLDIAEAVLFLVQNEYITGETLVVDGGYRLI
jgi:pteridine reductase